MPCPPNCFGSLLSGTHKRWFMKWGFSNGSKMHTLKYVRKKTYLLNPISTKPPLRKTRF